MEAPPPRQYGSHNKAQFPATEGGFGDSGEVGVVYLPGVMGLVLKLPAFSLWAYIAAFREERDPADCRYLSGGMPAGQAVSCYVGHNRSSLARDPPWSSLAVGLGRTPVRCTMMAFDPA